jgi:glutamate synthase domain-containing protein 2
MGCLMGLNLHGWLIDFISFMAALFIFAVGLLALIAAILFVIDVTQKKHAIRRNFPVIGRLRYLLEHLGKFFRQYFFAMDREELPFNREQRGWVYRAAKNISNTIAFGSTRDLKPEGTILFVNSAFPSLDDAEAETQPMVIGAGCKKPYAAPSLFNVSAMSYGALSKPAVRALSLGTAKAPCWLNTGEGGLAPYHVEGGGDVVFQMGTAKYGARGPDGTCDFAKLKAVAAPDNVRMVEIKLSQGAKPGKGGLLPGDKVTEEIARIRGIPQGEASISPNRHPEFKSNTDMLDFIAKVRDTTGKPTGIKFVLGEPRWFDDLLAEVVKRGPEWAPDFVTIDSADGGTGAAPMPLMDFVGLPVSESLPYVDDALRIHGLHDQVRVIASGKLLTPGMVAWALAAGADFVNNARGFMFALGCIQALQCNKNTCPTGVTTHNPRLQKGLVVEDKAERVAHYVRNIVKEVEMIAHSCGVEEPRQLRREHMRVVAGIGPSVRFDDVYPYGGPAGGANRAA